MANLQGKEQDLTTDCVSIEQGLNEVSNILASLYRVAIKFFLSYNPTDEDARVLLSHACYSMRDLMNDVPDSFPNSDPVPRRTGSEHEEIKLAVEAMRTAAIFNIHLDDERKDVVVSAELVQSLQRFYEYETDATQTSNERMKAASSNPNAQGASSLPAWKAAHDFFQRYIHVRSTGGALPSRNEVLGHVDAVNNVLMLKLGWFFATKNKISEQLALANKKVEGEFVAPSNEEVLKVISCLGDISMRFVFYGGLDNPNWVPALSRLHVFSATSVPMADGRYLQWPEGRFLGRMAGLAPQDVADAFASVTMWDNPYVLEAAISFASSVDCVVAKPVMEKIALAAQEGNFLGSYLWQEEELRNSVVKAFCGGKSARRVAERIVRWCLMPREKQGAMYLDEPVSCLPGYYYHEFLAAVIPSIPDRSLYGLVKELLEAYAKACGYDGGLSTISWRVNAVEDEVAAEYPSMLGSLIYAMAFSLSQRVKGNLEGFRRSMAAEENALIRRIAIFVLRGELERQFKENGAVDNGYAQAAQLVMTPDVVFDSMYDPELFPLLRTCVDSGVSIDPFWEVFCSGFDQFESKIRARLSRSEMTEDELEEEVRRYSVNRRHKTLSLLGVERLPDSLANDLKVLEEARGHVEYIERHVSTSTWVGPISPISFDEMKALDARRLVGHLKTWHPKAGSRFDSPSHSGQGQALTALIRENPFALADADLDKLRPIYCSAILTGWEEALRNGLSLPLSQVVDLCEQVAACDFPDGFEQEGNDYDDEADFRFAARNASSLLGEIASRGDRSEVGSKDIDRVLTVLIRIGNFYPVDSAYEQERVDEGTDVLNLAINVTHAVALDGILSWLKVCSEEQSGIALEFAASRLPNEVNSISDAVAIARNISSISTKSPTWVSEHLNDLFGTDSPSLAQKAALSTCLSIYRPNKIMSSYLAGKMIFAMNLEPASYPKGFAAYGEGNIEIRIGVWILMGVLYGYLSIDGDEVKAWDEKSDADSKRKSLNHICHVVGVSGEMPADAKDNFKSLYAHYESLAQSDDSFYIDPMSNHWLMKSGQFETSWWVSRFIASEQAHPDHNAIRMSQEELILLADDDPASAMELMMLGLGEASKSDGSFIWLARDMAPQILSKALCSDDEAVAFQAREYEDQLGFMGFHDLDERIDAQY